NDVAVQADGRQHEAEFTDLPQPNRDLERPSRQPAEPGKQIGGQDLGDQQQGQQERQPGPSLQQAGGIDQGADRNEEEDREDVTERQQSLPGFGRLPALGDGQAGDEGGQGKGNPEKQGTDPRQGEAAGHGHDEKEVVLLSQLPKEPWDQAGGDDDDDGVNQRQLNRHHARPGLEPERDQCDDRDGHPDQVLQDAPAQEHVICRRVGRSPPAARDVHHHHARRQRNRQPQQDGARRWESGQEAGRRRERTRQDRLQRSQPEEAPALASELQRIQLDSNLEEKQDDANVGEEQELLTFGHVTGREGRYHEADGEVSNDGREAKPSGDPA